MSAVHAKLVHPGKRRLDALTTLRFFAALHVVLFHCAPTLASRAAERLAALTQHSPSIVREGATILSRAMIEIMNAGPWSVSFFFILSGFILVYNYDDQRRPLDVPRFWMARFARIYPVYLIGFLLAMPFVLEGVRQAHGHSAHQAVTGGLLAATLLQSWAPRYAVFWNIPAWSLSVEAFFYAVFPLVLIRLRRFAGARALLGVIVGCWLVSVLKDPVIQFFARDLPSNETTALVRYFPLFRLPEFIAGMALGRIMLVNQIPAIRRAGLIAAAAMIGIMLLAALGTHRPGFVNASGALTPLFALIIWSLADDHSLLARALSKRPLIFLGESSYSIYILHLPLFAIWAVATAHWVGHSSSSAHLGAMNFVLPVVFLVAMIGVCGLVYRLIEVPVRDLIRSGYNVWVRPMAPIKALEPTTT